LRKKPEYFSDKKEFTAVFLKKPRPTLFEINVFLFP